MTKALLVDDEAPLRDLLRRRLADAWPELEIVGEAADGEAALAAVEALSPAVVFLDIRMPGLNGLEVAARLAGRTQVVFVTAYDDHALEAFDRAALDYLVKPVSRARLAQTVQRLKSLLPPPGQSGGATPLNAELLACLRQLLPERPPAPVAPLELLQVSRGNLLEMVPVSEIFLFQAADKYTLAHAEGQEWVIRKSLKELETQLDERQFWRVHRNAIVRVSAIRQAYGDEQGKLRLKLHPGDREIAVGRSYQFRFKAS